MKYNIHPKQLKFLIGGAGVLGLALRTLLYTIGFDGRGLLVEQHPVSIALWCLTAAAGAALLVFGFKISGPESYADAYPVSFGAAMGCFALALGLAVTTVREFSKFSTRLHLIIWVLGLVCAVAMVCVGIFRLLGKKPYFLFHTLLCVYFALRMVSLYRVWSSDPCLQDYCFYLCAYVTLMLTAYHQAAFDADMGKHRPLWIFSLAGVYLCCLSLKGSQDGLLLLGSAVWSFTNLTTLTASTRRTRPELKLDASDPQGE